MPTTLVTWNLKGSANPDVSGIVAYIRAQGADVVGLQEVQWHQARRIARALGARARGWGFKHWPVRTWPEGMAVIGVTRPVRVRTRALSHRWRPWSWRRRIMQVADVGAGGGDGGFTLVNLHLTPHGEAGQREAETATVLDVVAQRSGPVVVSGDLNERPGGPIHQQLASAGLCDGWATAADEPGGQGDPRDPDPWPTNWRGWRRGTSNAPTQQLDYVYASPAVTVQDMCAPRPGDDEFTRFAGLSDHLPVTAVLDVDTTGDR